MAKSHTPDVRQLGSHDLPSAAFPAKGPHDFRVYFAPEAHAEVARHAAENPSIEIGGVLAGQWERDADGPFVVISQAIRSDLAASKLGEVTFTHDAWAAINAAMDTRFPDLRIVGWYHSHPDFGIFLSQRDVFIHEHFFSNPGQIAYVVDPVREIEGVFAWRKGRPKLCPHYWVGNRIQARPGDPEEERPGPARRPSESPSQPTPADEAPPLASSLTRLALYLVVFLVGYLLASLPGAWQQRRLAEGAVAHYGIWKGLRPGLKENLDVVGAELKAVSTAMAALADEHVKLVGDDAATTRDEWNGIRSQLHRTQRLLDLIEEAYCLDADESAAVARIVAEKIAELGGGAPSGAELEAKPAEKTPATRTRQAPQPKSAPSANDESPKPIAPGEGSPAREVPKTEATSSDDQPAVTATPLPTAPRGPAKAGE
jgi:proteasome lid subunit RPN8/RPN11